MYIYQGCRSKLRRLGSAPKLSMKSHCRVQAFVGMLAPLNEHQIYIRCVAQLIMTGSHDSQFGDSQNEVHRDDQG